LGKVNAYKTIILEDYMKKAFKLNNQNDFAFYLCNLIIYTKKSLSIYERYHEELQTYIKDNQITAVTRVPKNVYEDFNNKMKGVNSTLLNLIGDHTKNAMSYKRFRSIAEKDHTVGKLLEPLSEELKRVINIIYETRNWGLHEPESLLLSKMEVAKREGLVSVVNPIIITDFECVVGNFLLSLSNETKKIVSTYNEILVKMLDDHSKIVEQEIKIEIRKEKVRSLSDMMSIVQGSWQMQIGKKN